MLETGSLEIDADWAAGPLPMTSVSDHGEPSASSRVRLGMKCLSRTTNNKIRTRAAIPNRGCACCKSQDAVQGTGAGSPRSGSTALRTGAQNSNQSGYPKQRLCLLQVA